MSLDWTLPSDGGLTCAKTRTKGASETRLCQLDLSRDLASGENIGGTPTITPNSSNITVTSVAASTLALVIDGSTVSTGQALTFKLSAGVAGAVYTLVAASTTTLGQILAARMSVEVVT